MKVSKPLSLIPRPLPICYVMLNEVKHLYYRDRDSHLHCNKRSVAQVSVASTLPQSDMNDVTYEHQQYSISPHHFLNMTKLTNFVKSDTFSSPRKSLMLYSAERCARLHKRNCP